MRQGYDSKVPLMKQRLRHSAYAKGVHIVTVITGWSLAWFVAEVILYAFVKCQGWLLSSCAHVATRELYKGLYMETEVCMDA